MWRVHPFCLCSALLNKLAVSVAKVLIHAVISQCGMTPCGLTDLRHEFQSELRREMSVIWNWSSSYHGILPIYKWDDWALAPLFAFHDGKSDGRQAAKVGGLPQFVMAAYKSMAHESTSFSPNFLLFGRALISVVDIASGCLRPPTCSANDYAYHMR